MANEATITSSLQVRKADPTDGTKILIDYQGRPSQFRADVAGTFGPYSPVVAAALAGTLVDLSSVGTPGLCRIANQGSNGADSAGDASLDNWLEFGVRDSTTGRFSPLGKVYPGESFVFRLSQNFGREYAGVAGTGSVGADLLFVKSIRTVQYAKLDVFPA